jgi:hypothetical protein
MLYKELITYEGLIRYIILYVISNILYIITSSISQNSKGKTSKIFGYIGICSGTITICVGIFYVIYGINVLLR